MYFVHNGDVKPDPISIGKMYIILMDRSDWEIAQPYCPFKPSKTIRLLMKIQKIQ